MYSFDEKGNILIDVTQANLIDNAHRNRTISRRALALSQNQFVPFQPISGSTWTSYITRLGTMYQALFQKMKVPTKSALPNPRSGNDFRQVYFKALNDWASVDLQGFKGVLPGMEVSGASDIVFFLPADGAVIRYLDRLNRKFPGFFNIWIGPGSGFTTNATTLDSQSVLVNPNEHGMTIRVREVFGSGISNRIEANVSTLKALLRTVEIGEIIEGLNKVLSTLSRKIHSLDGTWGEDPKFPIVNFTRKVDVRDWLDVNQFGRNFHGNNKELYGDRQVYAAIPKENKLHFKVRESSGAPKWTQPQQ